MCTDTTAAYGMYPRNVALSDVVCALNRAGFAKEDICMVLSPAHPDAAAVRDSSTFDTSVSDGGSARTIRWFSGFGAVVIPTIGFFARSQGFLEALFSEQTGSALSRGSKTLMGLGFSQDDAKRLGHQLCDMAALIYVSCPGRGKAEGAIELLLNAGAREAAGVAAGLPA